MDITKNTKVSAVIKHNIEAIDVIASINSHFEKLRNPILRKLLAPRVTLFEAAKIGKCDLNFLMEKLRSIGFNPESINETIVENSESKISTSEIYNEEDISYFDIRPLLEKGLDPFKEIMLGLKYLKAGQILCVISPFEPTPLVRILSKKNYNVHITQESNQFKTYIKSTDNIILVTETLLNISDDFQKILQRYKNDIIKIDVRDMEMPQPMILILERLNDLPQNIALFVDHKRIPEFLLPELKQRQFKITTNEINENYVQLLIYKE